MSGQGGQHTTGKAHTLDIRFLYPSQVQAFCRCMRWASRPWRPEHDGHLETAKRDWHDHVAAAEATA